MERDNFSGRAAALLRGRDGLVCQCEMCNALYAYRDGFSTFLGYR